MKLFKIFTPLTLVNLFAVWLIISGATSKDNLAALGIIVGLPILIVGLILDFIFRTWCKNRIGRLWVFECILILVAALIFNAIVLSNRD